MEIDRGDSANQFFGGLGSFLRKCIFRILSMGPIPNHIAFIMDGNRRYAKKQGMEEGAGHKAGFLALMKIIRYCYELGVKYLTVYAFSIENFKRKPEEVQSLMDLMLEKISELLKEESVVNQYGIRLYFIGNLKLLSESVRVAAEKAMAATAKNTKTVLLICVAYTSYDEIVHAVQESCKEKRNEIETLYASKVSNGVTEGVEEGGINGTTEHDVQGSCENSLSESQALNTTRACNGVIGVEKKKGVTLHAVQESCKEKRNEIETLYASKVSNCVTEGVEEGGINGTTEHDVQGSCENNLSESQALNTTRACNSVIGVEKKKGVTLHAVKGSCEDKWDEATSRTSYGVTDGVADSKKKQWMHPTIKLVDIEKNMYMGVAPDPEILIRTSGENRLSNFLLWQTTNCPLYSPSALWPEIGLWHLIWAVLNFQRSHYYFEKKKKQL